MRKSSSGFAGFARGRSRRLFNAHLPFTPSVDETDAVFNTSQSRVGWTKVGPTDARNYPSITHRQTAFGSKGIRRHTPSREP